MADTIEAPAFDPKAYLESQNAAHQAVKDGKAAPAPVAAKPPVAAAPPAAPAAGADDGDDTQPRLPRSARRQITNLTRENGELRGRLTLLEELAQKGKPAEKTGPAPAAADPEPQRGQFPDDAQYNRALGKWEARQETGKVLSAKDRAAEEKQEQDAFAAHLREMAAKAEKDKANFEDWDKVAEESSDETEAVQFVPAEHPVLMGLIATSDVQAMVLYHLGKHQDELEKLLALNGSSHSDRNTLIARFHRMEGRIEKLYTKDEPEKDPAKEGSDKKTPAAQAAGATPKDRTHPAEGTVVTHSEPGRTTAERDARKPRPSSEVTARGGSAPPDEPEIGSAAWMEKRNASKAVARY